MLANSLIIIVSLALATSVQASLYISTPAKLKQCEEATFIISGETGSVKPFVVDPTTPCGEPLLELNDTTGDFKWTPNLEVGRAIMLAVEDEAGEEAFSGWLMIQPGNSTSCLNKTYSASSAPAATPSSPLTTQPLTTQPLTTQPFSPSTQNSTNDTPKNVADSQLGDATSVRVDARVGGVIVITTLSALALAL